MSHGSPFASLLQQFNAFGVAANAAHRKAGKHQDSSPASMKPGQVTFICRNLSTLLENGVSLPKALSTLAAEEGAEKYRDVLLGLRRQLEHGVSFSRCLAQYPGTFDTVLVSQVKVGERAGNLAHAFRYIADQRETAGNLKSEIIKKLSYPILLVIAGICAICFLLLYVVPVFEETYEAAKVPLPAITQMLIALGEYSQRYAILVLLGLAALVLGVFQLRKEEAIATRMDHQLLRLPLVGNWLRDIALLQMMDALGNLLQAGFTLAEALGEAADTITNRAVQKSVRDLQKAVVRGERFSREIERQATIFPPLVSQLVIIGEQTGKLAKSTRHIRDHLNKEISRKTTVFVASIEPILTISMAGAVAIVLLAIYMPMFDMINTVG